MFNKKKLFDYSKNGWIIVLISAIIGIFWGAYSLIRNIIILNAPVEIISRRLRIGFAFEERDMFDAVLFNLWGYGLLGLFLGFAIIIINIIVIFNCKKKIASLALFFAILFIFILDILHMNWAYNLTQLFYETPQNLQIVFITFGHSPFSFGRYPIFNTILLISIILYYIIYIKGLFMNLTRAKLVEFIE